MWWKMSLAVVLGVVLGFGLDYAVVHHQAIVFARKCSIEARPEMQGIRFAIAAPGSCDKFAADSVLPNVVEFTCASINDKPDASICPTQMYERLKHPVVIGDPKATP